MAGTAGRVAWRQLSQHSRAGAQVLLRQVRAGEARAGSLGPRGWGGNPGSFKYGEIGSPWARGRVPGFFTEEGAGDFLESGDSWVLMKLLAAPQTPDSGGRKWPGRPLWVLGRESS